MFDVIRRGATTEPVGDYRRLTLRTDIVATHADYEAAAADADERGREAWSANGFNPFAFGPPTLLSTLPEPILGDWLLDHGIELWDPGEHPPYWYTVAKPDPLLVRGALDCLRFHTVEPAELRAFAVVYVTWGHMPVIIPPEYDRAGGIVRGVHSRRESAVRQPDRWNLASDPWSLALVIEVPADAPPAGRTQYVVGRWFAAEWLPTEFPAPRLPVRVCVDRPQADALAASLTTAAARWLNPFTVGTAESSVSHTALVAVALRLGLPDPPAGRLQLVDWYDRSSTTMTGADRLNVWATLTHPVFAVEEVPCE